MTEAPGLGRSGFVDVTVAARRERSEIGIVWLDRLSLVTGDGSYPSFGPRTAVIGSGGNADGERAATVGATVEVPPGHLVVDVRVGYALAAGGFAGALRFVDLGGHRKSALLLLEPAGDEAADSAFVDTPATPPGKRTFLSIRASVAERANQVAVRDLRLCLSRG
jgi:hypothetical protein